MSRAVAGMSGDCALRASPTLKAHTTVGKFQTRPKAGNEYPANRVRHLFRWLTRQYHNLTLLRSRFHLVFRVNQFLQPATEQ